MHKFVREWVSAGYVESPVTGHRTYPRNVMTDRKVQVLGEQLMREYSVPEPWIFREAHLEEAIGVLRDTIMVTEFGHQQIIFNPLYTPYLSYRGTVNSIKHELAHVFAGYSPNDGENGHGPEWKEWAIRLGANPCAVANITTGGEGC